MANEAAVTVGEKDEQDDEEGGRSGLTKKGKKGGAEDAA